MVLPAKHADVIRNLADNGGGGGGSTTHLHMNLSAFDSEGLDRVAKSPQFHKAIMQAARRAGVTR